MTKEKTNWRKCAIHNDDEIVKNLCLSIIMIAVTDWKSVRDKKGVYEYTKLRYDTMRFFNSTFFAEMLTAMAGDIDQKDACDAINNFNNRFLSHNAAELKCKKGFFRENENKRNRTV